MNKFKFVTSALTTALLSAGLFAANTAEAKDFKSVEKDLRILEKILETSLSGDRRYGSRVESMYLAEQGMVFTFNSGFAVHAPDFDGDWEAWGQSIGDNALSFVEEMVPALAPVLPPEALYEMESEIAKGRSELAMSSQVNEELKDELDAMRDKIRDQQEDYRDALRELRELERERYRADKERREEIDNEREKIQIEIDKNKALMDEYRATMEKYRAEKNKKVIEKKRNQESDAVGVICDYKASLRSINDDEHVTFIFKNSRHDGQSGDKYMVFKKSDILDCDGDNKDKEKLVRKAIVYVR